MLAEVRTARAASGGAKLTAEQSSTITEKLALPINKIHKVGANRKSVKVNIGHLDHTDVSAAVALEALVRDKKTADAGEQRDYLIERIANKIWIPTLPARCVAHKWGFWTGIPLAYDTVITEGAVDSTRRVTGRIAGGLAFSPNAYISFMVGFAYSVYRPDPVAPATEAPFHGIVTPTISIGGNLDILTLIGGR